MKTWLKIVSIVFCCTALLCGLFSYLWGRQVLDTAMEHALSEKLSQSRMLDGMLSTALNTLSAADPAAVDARRVETIRSAINESRIEPGRCVVRIGDEQGRTLYTGDGAALIWNQTVRSGTRVYFLTYGKDAAVRTLSEVSGLRVECIWDLREVYQEQNVLFGKLRLYTLIISCLAALAAFILIWYIFRPLKTLQNDMKQFGQGTYDRRTDVGGNDLLQPVAQTYNDMADTLASNIRLLESVAKQREDFVASFAHELKTPLTSIIGYADTLRLKVLPPEQVFNAANFIFSEGKRLESLSLKLMDLIVLRRQVFDLRKVSAGRLAEEINGVLRPMMEEYSMNLEIAVEDEMIYAEPDLLKTLLMNLVDNARKASTVGSTIHIEGFKRETGFEFLVRDHGRGIPHEELDRITEAFYMVDKSRARAMNGAGLGLALCQEIAKLHGSHLEFESEEGVGTTVHLMLGDPNYTPTVSPRRKAGRRR